MELFLLRHARAAEPAGRWAGRDAERPLTPPGARKMRRIAAGMRALRLSFDLVLSSPYARARQTAEIAVEVLRLRQRLQWHDDLRPDGSAERLLRDLARRSRSARRVLLIGHEPNLSELAGRVLCGRPVAVLIMKKGGLCKLAVSTLRGSQGNQLAWLLGPRHLVRLGRAAAAG
jgi:phosphohistidine phosphatase